MVPIGLRPIHPRSIAREHRLVSVVTLQTGPARQTDGDQTRLDKSFTHIQRRQLCLVFHAD
jgi:hypothetical protein